VPASRFLMSARALDDFTLMPELRPRVVPVSVASLGAKASTVDETELPVLEMVVIITGEKKQRTGGEVTGYRLERPWSPWSWLRIVGWRG
jgi:hypothetical protein